MSKELKVKEIKSAVAFLSGGIGLVVMAVLHMAQGLTGGLPGPVGQALMFHTGIGPYSGKQGLGVLAWVVAWVILSKILVNNDTEVNRIMLWTYILYGLATLLVFPPFLELL